MHCHHASVADLRPLSLASRKSCTPSLSLENWFRKINFQAGLGWYVTAATLRFSGPFMNWREADLIPRHFAVEVETRSTVAIFMGPMVKRVVWPTTGVTVETRKYFHPRQYCGFTLFFAPTYPPLFVTTVCVCVCVPAVCGWLPVFRCHVCCSFQCVWGAALAKQTCRGETCDGTPWTWSSGRWRSWAARDVIWGNLISVCGGRGWGWPRYPTTHGEGWRQGRDTLACSTVIFCFLCVCEIRFNF